MCIPSISGEDPFPKACLEDDFTTTKERKDHLPFSIIDCSRFRL